MAAPTAFVEVSAVTMCEFAEKYQLYRADVNTAVRLARLDPMPEKKLNANGQYVNTYAERELARLRMQGGGQGSPGKLEKADRAAKEFLIAAQLLPYDHEAMGSAEARKQCELIMRPIRAWVMDMQQALEFGALDAEGAVV
jgi:hypothetical protein